MTADRSILSCFESSNLEQADIIVILTEKDSHAYTLEECVGTGATGVTWRARDWQRQLWAIKFTLTADYRSHSLEQEVLAVRKLKTRRLAKIAHYGHLSDDLAGVSRNDFYAIVVEWVDGVALESFLINKGDLLTVPSVLHISQAMLEVIHELDRNSLCHNDLHDRNILVATREDPLTGDREYDVHVIDTGALKTIQRREALIQTWEQEHRTLSSLASQSGDVAAALDKREELLDWFSRTDHEWYLYHLVRMFNILITQHHRQDLPTKRFLSEVPAIIEHMDEPDPQRLLQDPPSINRELHALWHRAQQIDKPAPAGPFDALSAELVRTDRQLMDLFSEEFPGLDSCRSADPMYIYGPRGCGKSTVFRSLSLRAVLQSADPLAELDKLQIIGVYVSCTSELRSRFQLIPPTDYELLEAHIVRFFNLILIEQMIATIGVMYEWDGNTDQDFKFGIDIDAARVMCSIVRRHVGLSTNVASFTGRSPFDLVASQIRLERDLVWHKILDRATPAERPDSQVLFTICDEIETMCPVFANRRLAFLLDDYSNQRIPKELQRRLNQSISFVRQANPIFKVSSEYYGVDLDGIQEGREVKHLNVGRRYVDLVGGERLKFLKNVLEKRFEYHGVQLNIEKILPKSTTGPGVAMARQIRDAFNGKRHFYYHGIDTISDLCSGDFAMGITLIGQIFENANVPWRNPRKIEPYLQDEVIRRYAARQHQYIVHYAPDGIEKRLIMDQLCLMAHECTIKRSVKSRKQGQRSDPMIKIHLDIAEPAFIELQSSDPGNAALFEDLVHKGLLFPLDHGSAREGHQATRRFGIRRILLAKHAAPLTRQTPVRIDTLEGLRWLITAPREFVRREIDEDPEQRKFSDL